MIKQLTLALITGLLLVGCGQSTQNMDNQTATQKLDKWSWLPKSAKHGEEISRISKATDVEFSIPKDEPLDSKSDGWGKIDTFGNFVPTDKKSYIVKGGALISKLGTIEKKAHWGDWDFVYEDASHTNQAGWGNSLTNGEILLPRTLFLDPPTNIFTLNSFEIESFGEDYVLIRLDPAKNHRLCFMKSGRSQVPTAGYMGSKAEVAGKILERKLDGWYSGATRLSD